MAGGSEIKQTESTHGFSLLDAIYHDGSNWVKAQANSSSTLATHVVSEVIDSNNFKAKAFGSITSTGHGLSVGEYYFLSASSAGAGTSTEPTTGYSCPLYYVLDANTVIGMVYRPNVIGDGITSDSEIGAIVPFACDSAPTGFLACEGQAISRTTYADLFNVIGTTWGVGDGSTTFNVPDLRGMFLRGSGTHGSLTMADSNPYVGPSVGSSENDQFQGHWHLYAAGYLWDDFANKGTTNNSGKIAKGDEGEGEQPIDIDAPGTDGTNGTPRVGDETRPVNYGVKYCIRYAAKAALQGDNYYNETVYLKDVKATTTNGGTFTATAWRTRTLNTVENSQAWCSLNSNQFTLAAGVYKVKATAPAYACNSHQCKIYNISDSTNDIIGSSGYAYTSNVPTTFSFAIGILEINSSKTFELQHYCASTKTGNGFGVSANTGLDEIYSIVEIERIGDA